MVLLISKDGLSIMGWFALRTRVHIRRGSPRLFFWVSLFDIEAADGTPFQNLMGVFDRQTKFVTSKGWGLKTNKNAFTKILKMLNKEVHLLNVTIRKQVVADSSQIKELD